MKIAILGARGLVGDEFARQVSLHHDVIAVGRDELDITNSEAFNSLIGNERPALIVNCAVVGVDACEANPLRAHNVNVVGAENLARAAADLEAELVHFSTNYVFDGALSSGFYRIADPPRPLNVYGHTKIAGERAVFAANARSFVVRTSWVFGSGKNSFLSALPGLLRAGKKVRAISDVYASATYVDDLVKRVMEIVDMGRHATYHVVNSGVCSFAEFGFEVAHALGISQSDAVELIETTELRDFEFAAPRPRYTPMACKVSEELNLAPLRDWRAAVVDYVRDIQ